MIVTALNCTKLATLDPLEFQCMGGSHQIIILVTVLLGPLALAFVVAETLLFQNPDTKGSLPWRGMPSRIMLLKLLQKASVALFSFETLTTAPIAQVAFTLVAAAIVFVRLTRPIRYHWKPYLYWAIFSESTLLWFALWNSILKITKAQLTLYTLVFFVVGAGVAPIYWFVMQVVTKRRQAALLSAHMRAPTFQASSLQRVAGGQA